MTQGGPYGSSTVLAYQMFDATIFSYRAGYGAAIATVLFAIMGLRSRAPGRPIRPTPTATWDELVAFRAAARKLDYRSIGTAALLAWEWLQREQHVFGAFDISHYRPSERPNSVRIVHPKNGEEAWWPLFDEAGAQPVDLGVELGRRYDMYTAGVTARAAHPNEAAVLIALLTGADHKELRQRVGFAG